MEFRIFLRALEPEDYLTSIKWRQDKDIKNMVGGPKYFVSRERERQWVLDMITSHEKILLAICLNHNNKYIGNISLYEINQINRSSEISIMIGEKSEWGKGYATEACMLMLDYAFNERGLERIYALILENNIGSISTLKHCGFKEEGLMRNSVYKNGKFHNQKILGVLRPEFEKAYFEYCNKHNIK